ncbi:MAG: CBS domain-containing protein [Euryarchaeota archaeon]|nr:CBS domain-containing protein [Euryarchaeota archaeon]MCD6158993.1 CBS domain-containing protein [Euryarchaeota archaeon]
MEKFEKAADLMTRDVIVLPKAASLNEFVKIMEKYGITKVPVVDDGKFVGVISDRSVLDKIGSIRSGTISPSRIHVSSLTSHEEGKDYYVISPDTPIERVVSIAKDTEVPMFVVMEEGEIAGVITKSDLLRLVKSDVPIEKIMKRNVFSVAPDDRIIHARHMMLNENIERLPVLHKGIVVGIISEMDIALHLVKIKEHTPTKWIQQHLREALIRDVMKTEVICADLNTSASDAAQIMWDEGIGCLPIVLWKSDEDESQNIEDMDSTIRSILEMRIKSGKIRGYPKIMGIITRTDLIRLISV